MSIEPDHVASGGGLPATELSDEELEHQGQQAHETRTWVVFHGTAEQYRNHTERMLELEAEYLRRHPKRTWQGRVGDDAPPPVAPEHREQALLQRYAEAPDGRLHKLEAHQVAREIGLSSADVAAFYKADPPLLSADGQYRVITEAGRAKLD